MSVIKTPDQRLRVFISSTINELADERKAVTDAVAKLRLIPVLFELGARPHPPRELYRAYLEQSHVFIGIYWNSYGWIAPDMDISGLEDEYRLSEGKTKLIYVKQPDDNRDPKLVSLLQEIQKSDTVCYRPFTTADELKELVQNDLALLLSERFEQQNEQQPVVEKLVRSLPVIHTKLIGREKELAELQEYICNPEVSLLTLTGPGGTGKTRLAIQLAHNVKQQFTDGVYYVPLASITDTDLVAATIAHTLGLFDAGKQAIKTTLIDYVCDKHILIVLDNFEQIVNAAVLLNEILERCSCVKMVVTSRTPLYIRAEHIYQIMPLKHPEHTDGLSSQQILQFSSVELFIQRAKAVNPNLQLNDENIHAISEICRRLDGLPLAIELAASRSKYLSPVAISQRMNKALDFLSHGLRDLPTRQQTLRATIDWSYNLLDDDCRKFFYRLAVFKEGWTLDAAEAVANAHGDIQAGAEEMMEKLADLGLLKVFSHYNERQATVEPRFMMLQTVLEYATEKLEASNELPDVAKAHADYFIKMAEDMNPHLWSVQPEPWLDVLEREFQNLRAAFINCVEAERVSDCWQLYGAVLMLWVTRGRINESVEWRKISGISVESARLAENIENIPKPIRARALLAIGCLKVFETDYKNSALALEQCIQLFDELNDITNKARAFTFAGIGGISNGDIAAAIKLKQAIQLGYETNDVFSIVMASNFAGEVSLITGNYEQSAQLFESAREMCMKTGFTAGLAVVLSQVGGLYIAQNDFEKAEASYIQAIELFKQTSQVSLKGWAHLGLGYCMLLKNDFHAARKNFNDALECGRETGDHSMMLVSLTGFAGVAAGTGDCVKAARLYGAAQAILKRINYVSWSVEMKMLKWVEDRSCESIGQEQFQQEKEKGKSLLPEQAIAMALSIHVAMPEVLQNKMAD